MKNPTANAGDAGDMDVILGLGRSAAGRHDDWRRLAGCKEHGVAKRQARLQCLSTLQSFYHEFPLLSSLFWFISWLVGFCPCLVFPEGLLSSVSLNS